MVPLLHLHLQAAEFQPPMEHALAIKALTLRHRWSNQVRMQALRQLVVFGNTEGIPVILLKGGALANILYPDPGLRPMRDLDILAFSSDLLRIQDWLMAQGFQTVAESAAFNPIRHLPALRKMVDGFEITIEVHSSLTEDATGRPHLRLTDFTRPFYSFRLADNLNGLTLGLEDQLFHLCHHAIAEQEGFPPLRLISVTDILNYSERYYQQLDWEYISQKYPLVPHTISTLQLLRPLPNPILQTAGISRVNRLSGVGAEYTGWPRFPFYHWKKLGRLAFLRATFFPSAWWLHLHYAAPRRANLVVYWGRHLVNLSRYAWQRLSRRMSARKNQKSCQPINKTSTRNHAVFPRKTNPEP